MAQKNSNSKVVFILITILVATPLFISRYFDFKNPCAFDAASYVYEAKQVLGGAKIGIDIEPIGAIGPLVFSMIGVLLYEHGDIGPKIVLTALQIIALFIMFVATRKLYGLLSAAAVVILTSFYLSVPFLDRSCIFRTQCMVVFMIIGISCFVVYNIDRKWWYAVLAGAFLSWAPLFKETGVSAAGAVFIFTVVQPLLRNRAWRQAGRDVFLLLAGGLLAVGPLYVWMIAADVRIGLFYFYAWKALIGLLPIGVIGGETGASGGYIVRSREVVSFSEQFSTTLRYYKYLLLPITLAFSSVFFRLGRIIIAAFFNRKVNNKSYERFVPLFTCWWFLDMVFAWISPRSYFWYFVPQNASAIMLGGYILAFYSEKLRDSTHRMRWQAIGFAGFCAIILMSWPLVAGINEDFRTGRKYRFRYGGYWQRINELFHDSARKRETWLFVAEYIRNHSLPSDEIYVWGRYPGIYVVAQRFSSVPKPNLGEIQVYSPKRLAEEIDKTLDFLKRRPPRFIVDVRPTIHFPPDRPPLELWPRVKDGFMGAKKHHFLPLDKNVISEYDKAWSQMLRERFGEDEALRYEAMRLFREYVMENYRIVKMFGRHVLFELKRSTASD